MKKKVRSRKSKVKAKTRRVQVRRPVKRHVRKAPALPPAVVLPASDVPAMGKPWEGRGGIRIGEFAGENGKPGYHLLLATDAAGNPILLDSQRWGDYGQEVAGATSLNDGAANTDAMIAAGSSLAKAARSHGDDCHLPAFCEVQSAFAHARDLLPKEWLWSSTQCSANNAWHQVFSSGITLSWYKGYTYRGFVVRRVPIQVQ